VLLSLPGSTGNSELSLLAGLDPGVLWATALIVGLGYSLSCARRNRLDQRALYVAGLFGIVFGLWGGHLLGIFYYGTDGRPLAWLRFWSGGQAQYGGLIAGCTAVLLFLRFRKVPPLAYADAMAPAAALGVSIGRIGCFLNGDDFGSLSGLPWAVQFSPGTEAYSDHLARGWIHSTDALSLPVHPIQLYASLLWLSFFVILTVRRQQRPGLCLALFLILQGLGRFAEQFLRGDFQPILGPLSLTQIISLLFIAAGTGLWRYQSVRVAQDRLRAIAPLPSVAGD